jgi:threonine synthase
MTGDSTSGIWRWAERIDPEGVVPPEARITMGEGPAPLVKSTRIGPQAGFDLWFLDLTGQPTLSYKAVFAAAAVSHMIAQGQTRALLTSSGNTGSAVAAYCARAGISCTIAVSDGTPVGKLRKMAAAGARIIEVENFGADPSVDEQVLEILTQARDAHTAMPVSNHLYSPEGMRGAETFPYFIDADAGLERLDHVFVPAGSGALARATAQGFSHPAVTHKPAVHLVQPAGCDTIATALRDGRNDGRVLERATTAVTGLKVPFLLDVAPVIAMARNSGGTGFIGSDQEIYDAQARLAREEGILAEPAGAASVMGALKAVTEGVIRTDDVVICLVTGSVFNDEEAFERMTEGNLPRRLEVEALAEHL